MTTKTQCDRILEILETEGQIDNFRAIGQRISLRLGARIHDLRARGYEIETKELPDKNTVYRLIPKQERRPSFDGFTRYAREQGYDGEIVHARRAELYQKYVQSLV
jgi:hypothetical protein